MTLYLFAAVLFVISLILIRFTLPSVPKIFPADNLARSTVSGWKNTSTRGLFIASVLMWTCNMMYIIDMPLYISSTLGMPEKVAGVLMGTAAGLEIPVMILAGMLAKRIGKRPLVLLAVTAGVLFTPACCCSTPIPVCWRCKYLTPSLSVSLPGWLCCGFRI